MISSEKENVKFLRAIDVNEGARKGNVEIWLKEIESLMMETLKEITRNSICDTKVERIEWVRRWPGQIILSVNMSRWTIGAEIAISKGQHIPESIGAKYNFKSLEEFFTYLEKDLKQIVSLVRQELTPLERETLGALVVLDVHNKDVVEHLIKAQVDNIFDFKWISQLRYYW